MASEIGLALGAVVAQAARTRTRRSGRAARRRRLRHDGSGVLRSCIGGIVARVARCRAPGPVGGPTPDERTSAHPWVAGSAAWVASANYTYPHPCGRRMFSRARSARGRFRYLSSRAANLSTLTHRETRPCASSRRAGPCWESCASRSRAGMQAASADPPDPQFVQANGTPLTRDGPTFRFRGAAIYGTSNLDDPASTKSQVLDEAEEAHLNDAPARQHVRRGRHSTRRPVPASRTGSASTSSSATSLPRGMVAVLDLSASATTWSARHPAARPGRRPRQPNAPRPPGRTTPTDPYRAGAAAEWQAFINFVTTRVNTVTGTTYRDDPTIAVISIAGEPPPPTGVGGVRQGDQHRRSSTDFDQRTLAMLALAATRTTSAPRAASGRPTGSTSALAVAAPASTAARSSPWPTTPCPRSTRTR